MKAHTTVIARRSAVRLQMHAADIGRRIDDLARHRLDTLQSHGERGAQAAEYAMLGGVSAAACTGLVTILKNRDTLRSLVEAILGALGGVVEGWF